jgi:hypothetical protein
MAFYGHILYRHHGFPAASLGIQQPMTIGIRSCKFDGIGRGIMRKPGRRAVKAILTSLTRTDAELLRFGVSC